MAVGNYRNQTGSKGFDATNGFALHIRCMYIQVGIQQVLYQLVTSYIDELRLVLETLA